MSALQTKCITLVVCILTIGTFALAWKDPEVRGKAIELAPLGLAGFLTYLQAPRFGGHQTQRKDATNEAGQ